MKTKSSWGWYRVLFIALSIAYIFVGASLLINPAMYAGIMIYTIGFMAIFYGVWLIGSYFFADSFRSVFTLITGILLLVVGFLISGNVFRASIALGVVAAIGFLAVGIFKIYQAFGMRSLGVSSWWTILFLAACNIIVGLIMMFNLNDSGALITLLIGTNMLVNGVSDLMLGITGFHNAEASIK